ncbi:putative RNA methyltransferase-domain-containing protein [Massariosphaeria phaeospora]|uniref:Putative RNA methyltransferase-domain-containing protein n=1 Tax=Massariosphaeria phaeospora TaxID=100035 RepID=A0A7C8I7H6_9PLEO|nr:putative RNA methyltransferase-domain-containing protein [Massariosphaeria phaeospora]
MGDDTIEVVPRPVTSSAKTAKGKKRKHASPTVIIHQKKDAENGEDDTIWDVEVTPEPPSKKRTKRVSSSAAKKQRNAPESTTNGTHEAEAETEAEVEVEVEAQPEGELDTSKPSAVFKPVRRKNWTVSLALPGSFIANVSTLVQKTILAGRIARTCATFCIDEIVIFDDDPPTIPDKVSPKYRPKGSKKTKQEILESIEPDDQPFQNPDQFLHHVLAYAEAPPYLKDSLFPRHPNLGQAGVLPSLDMPHHMRADEWCRFREGVALDKSEVASFSESSNANYTPKSKSKSSKSKTAALKEFTYVYCGLPFPVKVPGLKQPGERLSVRFTNADPPPSWPNLSQAEVENLEIIVADELDSRPEAEGWYWGYTVRRANSLSAVYTECPYKGTPCSCETDCDHRGGYSFAIATSERGVPLSSIMPENLQPPPPTSKRTASSKSKSPSRPRASTPEPELLPPTFTHLLIVIGGVSGLEPAVAADSVLVSKAGLTKETAHQAFDYWVNLVPGQGSRTIRTEEAVDYACCLLKEYVDSQWDARGL